MLVSDSHRFLFVHVQKTAGTSLQQALQTYALNPSAGRWNKIASDLGLVRDWRKVHYRKHASLRKAQTMLPDDIYRSCFKFAFVRNPWGRLVSWYRYVQNTPSHEDCKPGQPFEEFARAYLAKDRRSQWRMIENADGKMGLDFVGRFETLDDDVAHICRTIGVDPVALPHRNQAALVDYRAYYDDSLAEAVQSAWKTEIDFFGYHFSA